MYYRALLAVGVIALSIVAGLWLGDHWDDLSALWRPQPTAPGAVAASLPEPEEEEYEAAEAPAFDPPLYFYAGLPAGGDMSVVSAEAALAAGAGIHRHMLAVPLPWPDPAQGAAAALERLDALFAADPEGKAVVCVDLNPPASWLERHPTATVTVDGVPQPFACVASEAWLADARNALTALLQAVRERYAPERLLGCMIGGLESGRWYRDGGYDACQDNVIGFRRWLRLRYANDDQLRKAWADDAETLEGAGVPENLDPDTEEAFLTLPEMQRHADFLQYTSEAVADAIAVLAAHVKEQAGPGLQVFAPYGYSFEIESNADGQLGFAKLLDSPVDVFVSPVSYADRGVGGAGGYMGPIDSALEHDKQWLLIDDTRLASATDPADPDAAPLAPAADDVLSVQRRNFAAALCRGVGLAWADPEGAGWLNDADTWNRLGRMRSAYAALYAAPEGETETVVQPLYEHAALAVVVDEASRFCERPGDRLGVLLRQYHTAALRAGLPVQFYLLQDVLRDTVPPASVYWFVNAFRLTPEQRARLHEILQREKAAAVWSYTPGYVGEGVSVENIAATVGMSVTAFKNGGQSGSAYDLAGKWIAKGDTFGTTERWDPLIWIDDEKANVLARYADSKKPSVGLVYREDGWRSVYAAEPAMTPAMLREILTLLEEHIYFRKTPPVTFDAAYFAPELIAVHAVEAGDRPIDFGQVFDVQDLFDPEAGWPRTRLINLTLYPGETRVLRLQPSLVGR